MTRALRPNAVSAQSFQEATHFGGPLRNATSWPNATKHDVHEAKHYLRSQ